MDICPKCGLPVPACVCEEIMTENQQITITTEKRRFGKISTMVSGVDTENIKEIAKKLKNKLACGGTIKNNIIELQGDHRHKIKNAFVEMGFTANQIQIK